MPITRNKFTTKIENTVQSISQSINAWTTRLQRGPPDLIQILNIIQAGFWLYWANVCIYH